MANRIRTIDEARIRWRDQARGIGAELRTARRMAGTTQRAVAEATGSSKSEISLRELGRSRGMTPSSLAAHAAAVGLRMWIRLYPAGSPLRDAAQARYIAEIVRRVAHRYAIQAEAPVPRPGDHRAADLLLTRGDQRIALEVVTRLTDLQAQLRAMQLKARNLEATRLICVVADTHANARVLREARPLIGALVELDSRRVLAELAAGRDPGRDAVVALRLRPVDGHRGI